MSKQRFRLGVYILLTILIMALIFAFSSHDADKSQALSDGVLFKLLSLLNMQQYMERYEILIRKLAHFSLYFALGLSSCLMFYEIVPNRKRPFKAPAVSLVFSVLYAASDEIHQFFVPGRSMQFSDVLLDSAGALTAILLLYSARKLVFRLREERKEYE